MTLIVPKFSIICGTNNYTTEFKLTLPFVQRRSAVLVSGGLDSAFLYYLVRLLCAYNIKGRCNNCNRCNERRWAFEQLGKVDTGIL